jgi:transcription initiation factor TFIIIB Brf1 subunit/transcription initiation factor TFIIB
LLLTCPICRSGLQVPDGTTAMVRCPACKHVFSAAAEDTPPPPTEEVREEEREEPEVKPKTIVCPTCGSGLQVPGNTTAMIRCPACKTVFSPAEGLSPSEPEEFEDEAKPKKTKRTQKGRDEEEDEDKPRKKASPGKSKEESEKETSSENRDFDPPDTKTKPKKRRRDFEDEVMSEEERIALRAAFTRAAWGARLIHLSIVMFMLSMLSIIAFYFQSTFSSLNPAFLYVAGMLGLVNWILGAVGVGLCLSGPPSRGHWGYGISAAGAVFLHMLLLLMLIGSMKEYANDKTVNMGVEPGAIRWKMVATLLDQVTFYLTFVVYQNEQDVVPKSVVGLAIAVGVMEMIRTVLIMMLLSCLAQAGGDDDLSRACTRAAGTASLGPGGLSIVVLIYVMFVIETNATGLFIRIVFLALSMGIYAYFAGCMFRAMMAARETVDVCEEPYQSQMPHL